MKKILLGAACATALLIPLAHGAEVESVSITGGVINLQNRVATLTGSVLVSCRPDEDDEVPLRIRTDIDQKWGNHHAHGYKYFTLNGAHCPGNGKGKRILVSFKNAALRSLKPDGFKPGTRATVSAKACELTAGHQPDCADTRSAIKLHPYKH